MENLTVKELQVKAKNEGIALSYTKEDGKRHKLNKPELIKAIEAKQVEAVETTDVQPVTTKQRTVTSNVVIAQPVKTNAIIVTGENIKLNYKPNKDQVLNLNTLVKDSKRLLQLGLTDKVKASIKTLNNKIKEEKRNKLLVARMSQIRNILTALVKQSNKKVISYA